MPYTLLDFLASLVEAKTQREYSQDPEGTLRSRGLSEEQIAGVLSGNIHKVRCLLAEEIPESLHAQLILQGMARIRQRAGVGQDHDREYTGPTDINIENEDDNVQVHNDDIHPLANEVVARVKDPYYPGLFDDPPRLPTRENMLTIVGTGIMGVNHLTEEARHAISSANRVLYCVADLVMERYIRQLNPNFEDLYAFYGDDKQRIDTYKGMVTRILDVLSQEAQVCVVFYGHPGIFVWPSYQAVTQARALGFAARILPAVSSLDCLFTDVGIDPSRFSCQIFEATDLLVRNRRVDPTAAVLVLQVACVGDPGYSSLGYDSRNVPLFAEYLAGIYGEDFEVILYEASQYPICGPKVTKVTVGELGKTKVSGIATLYIPPKEEPKVDKAMVERLGMYRRP